MSAAHTRSTARIQRRLEQWELPHLRKLAAQQAERVEQLEARVEELEREASNADARAEMWHDSFQRLEEHLNDGTADARSIGLTPEGDLLVIRTGAMQ